MNRAMALLLMSAVSLVAVSGEDLVFPPELRWWIDEAQKANSEITLDSFRYASSEKRKYDPVKIDANTLYPVLFRWNYSGDRYAYYDRDISLRKESNGKYSVLADIDSQLSIFTRDGTELFSDTFGSSKGLNGVFWTRDTVLVAVGIWIDTRNRDKVMVDLIIREYRLGTEDVQIKEYILKGAFDNELRTSLHLNWWEQRPDYFNVD